MLAVVMKLIALTHVYCALNCILPKETFKSWSLIPMNVILLKNRVFAAVIDIYIKTKSYWVKAGLQTNHWPPDKKKCAEGKWPCDIIEAEIGAEHLHAKNTKN